MAEQSCSNLTGKVLIASPFTMEGSIFHKSLIYVLKHHPEGSIGLIINKPIKSHINHHFFNENVAENCTVDDLALNIHIGGPVEIDRGFFLHSSEYDKNLLFRSTHDDFAVSSNVQILKDIANGIGPKRSLFIIGYTRWVSSQLDFELENNLWIVSEPNDEIIFAEDVYNKWKATLNTIGVTTEHFIPGLAKS